MQFVKCYLTPKENKKFNVKLIQNIFFYVGIAKYKHLNIGLFSLFGNCVEYLSVVIELYLKILEINYSNRYLND